MTTKQQIQLNIQGMTCLSCATHLTEALKEVAGVDEVNVPGWESGQATLTADSTVSDEALAEAVKKAGYKATVATRDDNGVPESERLIDLKVQGMTCDSCAVHVVKALQGVEGVKEADVPGWQSGQATLTADPTVSDSALVEAVQKTGYRATISTPWFSLSISRGRDTSCGRVGGVYSFVVSSVSDTISTSV